MFINIHSTSLLMIYTTCVTLALGFEGNKEICLTKRIGIVEKLESPRITTKGIWGPWEYCPNGTYIVGMNVKVEAKHKGDNSGLNGVAFTCKLTTESHLEKLATNVDTDLQTNCMVPKKVIWSHVGGLGDWRGWSRCQGVVTGFQIRAVDEFRCGEGDNIGATDLRLFCSTKDAPDIASNILELGTWREQRNCPVGSGICGLRTQVEMRKNGTVLQNIFHKCENDNTGLNNIDVACCQLPRLVEICQPDIDNIWVDELGCGPKLSCRKTFKKGITNNESKSKSSKDGSESATNYEASLEGSVNILKARFQQQLGKKRIDGIDLNEVFGSMSTEEEAVDVDMSKCQGKMQQMVLMCGSIRAKTGMFRCVEEDNIFMVYRDKLKK